MYSRRSVDGCSSRATTFLQGSMYSVRAAQISSWRLTSASDATSVMARPSTNDLVISYSDERVITFGVCLERLVVSTSTRPARNSTRSIRIFASVTTGSRCENNRLMLLEGDFE